MWICCTVSIYPSFHPSTHVHEVSSVPSQFLAYFHLRVLQYSVSLILMKSFVLLPSPNSVYIRGRTTSLQGFSNSFCWDNTTDSGWGQIRWLQMHWGSHWNGPCASHWAKWCNTMKTISIIMSCSCNFSSICSCSGVVTWQTQHPWQQPPLRGPLPSLSKKRHLKLVNHVVRSQQTSVRRKILGTYFHIWCFLIRGWQWKIPQVELIPSYGGRIGSFVFQELFKPYFMWFFRSSDSLEWYPHWTYELFGSIGPCFSRTYETPCMEWSQNWDTYRCLQLSYLPQLSF